MSEGFKDERLKKDPMLWELYYAMLKDDGIYSDGYGLYPVVWRHAKVASEYIKSKREISK